MMEFLPSLVLYYFGVFFLIIPYTDWKENININASIVQQNNEIAFPENSYHTNIFLYYSLFVWLMYKYVKPVNLMGL